MRMPMVVVVRYRNGGETKYTKVKQVNEELPHVCKITYGEDENVDLIPWDVISIVEVAK